MKPPFVCEIEQNKFKFFGYLYELFEFLKKWYNFGVRKVKLSRLISTKVLKGEFV